jgi:hypothetical protein
MPIGSFKSRALNSFRRNGDYKQSVAPARRTLLDCVNAFVVPEILPFTLCAAGFALPGFPQAEPCVCDEQPLLRIQKAQNPNMCNMSQKLVQKFASHANAALGRKLS